MSRVGGQQCTILWWGVLAVSIPFAGFEIVGRKLGPVESLEFNISISLKYSHDVSYNNDIILHL